MSIRNEKSELQQDIESIAYAHADTHYGNLSTIQKGQMKKVTYAQYQKLDDKRKEGVITAIEMIKSLDKQMELYRELVFSLIHEKDQSAIKKIIMR